MVLLSERNGNGMRDREDEVEANVKYEISYKLMIPSTISAELAQSVERTTLNRVVEGSIPSFGGHWYPTYLFSHVERNF